jgi:hypothetical protein
LLISGTVLVDFGIIFKDFGHGFGIDFCINFAGRQEPPRTSQEPAKNQAHNGLLKT